MILASYPHTRIESRQEVLGPFIHFDAKQQVIRFSRIVGVVGHGQKSVDVVLLGQPLPAS